MKRITDRNYLKDKPKRVDNRIRVGRKRYIGQEDIVPYAWMARVAWDSTITNLLTEGRS
jgi:hypothetical protein